MRKVAWLGIATLAETHHLAGSARRVQVTAAGCQWPGQQVGEGAAGGEEEVRSLLLTLPIALCAGISRCIPMAFLIVCCIFYIAKGREKSFEYRSLHLSKHMKLMLLADHHVCLTNPRFLFQSQRSYSNRCISAKRKTMQCTSISISRTPFNPIIVFTMSSF